MDSGEPRIDPVDDTATDTAIDTDTDTGPPADPCSGASLLVDGGFEEGESTWPGVAAGWETNDAAAHPDQDALVGDVVHGGSWSQRIATGGQWDAGMLRQVSAYGSVQAGQPYRLGAWVRTEGMSNPSAWYVLGLWWFSGDTWVGEIKNDRPKELNYEWTELVIEGVAPESVDRAAAILSAHFDGTAFYDDVVLCRAPGE